MVVLSQSPNPADDFRRACDEISCELHRTYPGRAITNELLTLSDELLTQTPWNPHRITNQFRISEFINYYQQWKEQHLHSTNTNYLTRTTPNLFHQQDEPPSTLNHKRSFDSQRYFNYLETIGFIDEKLSDPRDRDLIFSEAFSAYLSITRSCTRSDICTNRAGFECAILTHLLDINRQLLSTYSDYPDWKERIDFLLTVVEQDISNSHDRGEFGNSKAYPAILEAIETLPVKIPAFAAAVSNCLTNREERNEKLREHFNHVLLFSVRAKSYFNIIEHRALDSQSIANEAIEASKIFRQRAVLKDLIRPLTQKASWTTPQEYVVEHAVKTRHIEIRNSAIRLNDLIFHPDLLVQKLLPAGYNLLLVDMPILPVKILKHFREHGESRDFAEMVTEVNNYLTLPKRYPAGIEQFLELPTGKRDDELKAALAFVEKLSELKHSRGIQCIIASATLQEPQLKDKIVQDALTSGRRALAIGYELSVILPEDKECSVTRILLLEARATDIEDHKFHTRFEINRAVNELGNESGWPQSQMVGVSREDMSVALEQLGEIFPELKPQLALRNLEFTKVINSQSTCFADLHIFTKYERDDQDKDDDDDRPADPTPSSPSESLTPSF